MCYALIIITWLKILSIYFLSFKTLKQLKFWTGTNSHQRIIPTKFHLQACFTVLYSQRRNLPPTLKIIPRNFPKFPKFSKFPKTSKFQENVVFNYLPKSCFILKQDQVKNANSAIIFLINHWSIRIVKVVWLVRVVEVVQDVQIVQVGQVVEVVQVVQVVQVVKAE